MAATNTAFTFFNSFKNKLGSGAVNLGLATTFNVALHHSGANLSANTDVSTYGSVGGLTSNVKGSAERQMANNTWTALSAAPSSQFVWDSDAIVWTATSDDDMTVKFAVFFLSVAANSGIPIGYIGLVASDQVVTAGNTVTLTPNTYWFKMSG